MRRLFILLLSLTILFGHAFASDCHISLQCSFPAHTDSNDIHADLYEKDTLIYFLSSLLPESGAYLKNTNHFSLQDMALILQSGAYNWFIAYDDLLSRFFTDRIASHSVSHFGYYSGDLFKKARKETVSESNMTDMIRFLADRGETEGKNVSGATARAWHCVFSMFPQDCQIRLKSYDDGLYRVIQFYDTDKPILSFSADLHSGNEKKYLLSSRENGKIYWRLLTMNTDAGNPQLSFSLYSDEAVSFREVNKELPVFTERISFTPDTNEGYSFDYVLENGKIQNPLIIQGNVSDSADKLLLITASVFIRGNEKSAIKIQLEADETTIPENLAAISKLNLDDENDRAAAGRTIGGKLSIIFSGIIPDLPEPYLTMITELLYR